MTVSTPQGKRIGFALTGSYCTFDQVLPIIENLSKENEVTSILSYAVSQTDTRYYEAEKLKKDLLYLTKHPPITTIVGAEPIGPQKLLDIMVIAPCTGNTLAKLANSITDTPVLMAAKAHLRNDRPLLIAVSSNDALAGSAKNIGALLNYRNIFFVPFKQDDADKKPRSMVADFSKIPLACFMALEGKQLQPIYL